MDKETFKKYHRLTRCGCLGTVYASVSHNMYNFFRDDVFDLRYPWVGDGVYEAPRSFCNLVGRKYVKTNGKWHGTREISRKYRYKKCEANRRK